MSEYNSKSSSRAVREPRIQYLITQYQAGSKMAADELFNLVEQRLLLLVSHRMGPLLRARSEPREVLHEVWIEIMNSLDRHPPKGSFFPWASSVASHKITKLRDRAKRDPRSEASVFSPSSSVFRWDPAAGSKPLSQGVYERESVLSIVDAIEQLPQHQQTVLRLVWIEGRSIGEVAKRLNRSPGNVRTLKARAGASLRMILGSLNQSQPENWD